MSLGAVTFADLLRANPSLAARIRKCPPDPRGELPRATVRAATHIEFASSDSINGHFRHGKPRTS